MPAQEQKILRVEIDGTWTADEFSDSLRSITEIYGLRAVLGIEQQSLNEMEMYYEVANLPFRGVPRRLRAAYLAYGFPLSTPLIDSNNPSGALRLLEPNEQLYVEKIQFASPGFKDLAGLGEIVGHVKEFLQTLINVAVHTPRRRLEEEKLAEDVETKRIENARSFVGLAKDLGYSNAKIRQLIGWTDDRQAKLLPLAREGKIRGVRLLNRDSTEREDVPDKDGI